MTVPTNSLDPKLQNQNYKTFCIFRGFDQLSISTGCWICWCQNFGTCCCDRKSRVACAQSFAPWQQATIEIMRRNLSYYCLLAPHTYIFVLHTHPVRGESHNQRHRRVYNNIPSFLQRTAPIARSLCEGWTRHDLHILVTAPFCCDRKSRVACAQSFAPWQQAAIEIMRRNLSYYCLLAPRIYIVVLRAHPVRGESHNQRNATREVATIPYFKRSKDVGSNNTK